jgi:hypothetical protein
MKSAMPAFPTRPSDTAAGAERVQVALLRAAPVSRRLHVAWSLSARAITAARRAIARADPGGSELDHDLRFVAVHYGAEVARAVRRDLARRSSQP